MARPELAPAGVMCPEEKVGFIANGCQYVQWHSKMAALDIPAEHRLEILSGPSSLPPHRCPGMPLPSPSSAPSSDIPMPTQSSLPSARSCQVFSPGASHRKAPTLLRGCLISLVRSLLLQPL